MSWAEDEGHDLYDSEDYDWEIENTQQSKDHLFSLSIQDLMKFIEYLWRSNSISEDSFQAKILTWYKDKGFVTSKQLYAVSNSIFNDIVDLTYKLEDFENNVN